MTNTTALVVDNHSFITESQLIISQTFFYVCLFIALKKTLIDKRGMMDSYSRFNEEKLQIGAIYFAIVVLIVLMMLSIHSYEFKHFVIPITFTIIGGIILYEIRRVLSDESPLTLPSVAPVFTSDGHNY